MEVNEDSSQYRQGILRSRSRRRRFVVHICIVVIVLLALGVFVLDGWLGQSMKLLSLYWGVVFMLTCLIMVLALYDMRRVITEEKAAHSKEMAIYMRELAEEMKEYQEKKKDKEG